MASNENVDRMLKVLESQSTSVDKLTDSIKTYTISAMAEIDELLDVFEMVGNGLISERLSSIRVELGCIKFASEDLSEELGWTAEQAYMVYMMENPPAPIYSDFELYGDGYE